MIGKAKSISHGHTDLAYITGESVNKKHPEKIYRLYDNLMPRHLNAAGMWDYFQVELGEKAYTLKNDVVRMELSPAKEHTANFTMDDWRDLLLETLREVDNIEMKNKSGKVTSGRTNFMNSMFTAWLHFESDGEVPHIHIAALRVDENGQTNNDHNIHVRLQRAAEIVARRRGWTAARDVRKENLAKLQQQCEAILKRMQTFSFDDYFKAIEDLPDGYIVAPKYDKQGTLVNYVIYRDPEAKRRQPIDMKKLKKNKYKASDIGKGRHFMVSTLLQTWKKQHPELNAAVKPLDDKPASKLKTPRQQSENNTTAIVQKPCTTSAEPLQQECTPPATSVQSPGTKVKTYGYTTYKRDAVPYDYTVGDTTTRFYIPQRCMDYLNDEFDYRIVENCDSLIRMAVGVFVGMIDDATTIIPSAGGGGTTSDLPSRDKDDDDWRWMQKCAHYATARLTKKPKIGYHR